MTIGRDITERLEIIAEGFEQSGRMHAAATCDEAIAEIRRLRHSRDPRPRRRQTATRGLAHDLADVFGLAGLFPAPVRRPANPARADPRFDAWSDA